MYLHISHISPVLTLYILVYIKLYLYIPAQVLRVTYYLLVPILTLAAVILQISPLWDSLRIILSYLILLQIKHWSQTVFSPITCPGACFTV